MSEVNEANDLVESLFIKGDGWYGYFTSTEAPVQVEGEIDGHPFYFRSRYDAWTFSVDVISQDPVGVCIGDLPGFHVEQEFEGTPGLAGFISLTEAVERIEDAISAFRGFESVESTPETATTLPIEAA